MNPLDKNSEVNQEGPKPAFIGKPEETIELYLEHIRQRHQSEGTVYGTWFFLQRLADYCRRKGLADLRDATTETLLEYHRWVKERKGPGGEELSTTYLNRHAHMAKAFFKFLAERHNIMTDIGRDFPPLREPTTLPRGILTKEETMLLLQQPLLTTPLGFRDRTMLEVLYSTALRGFELCRLTLYDYDPQERMIRVIAGKGRKDRIVPVGRIAAEYLDAYVKNVRNILAQPSILRGRKRNEGQPVSSNLFLSVSGRALSTSNLHHLVRFYRQKAGLPHNITTHSLRHTCATEMLKGGASIRHVQELLGHADIKTTQIYTHVVPTDLKKAHARTAPSERRRIVEDVRFPSGNKLKWKDKRNRAEWYKLCMRKNVQKTGESGKE